MFLRPGALTWIVLGAVLSGTSTYALLAVVAAGTGPRGFDAFSLYWAVLIVTAVGGYLPVEQILARRSAAGEGAAELRGWAARWGVSTMLLSVLVLFVGLLAVGGASRFGPLLLAVFAVNLAAMAAQAALRGLAAGRHRLDHYAAVVGLDAVARTLGCALLAWAGARGVPAYGAAIALSCWLSVALALLLLRRDPPDRRPEPGPGSFSGLSREARALVPAMLLMQVLLNSPVLLAFAAGGGSGAGAGRVLAITSLVRTTVFLAQAAQAGYVARIAAQVHRGEPSARRSTVLVLAIVTGVAVLTVAGAGVAGPWLVRWVYGPAFVMSHAACWAAGLGVGVFLMAIVANDLSVAHGMHGRAGWIWGAGALTAVVTAVLVPDGTLHVFAPLVTGSAVALGLTALRPARGSRGRTAAGSGRHRRR